MRVLLLFPMQDQQTGLAIFNAFKNLGHEIMAVDAKRQPHDSYNAACEFEPDLVFCSRTQALTWKVSEIKAKFKNAIACTWNVDTRASISKYAHLFTLIKSCDYYFIVDTKTIPQWKKINPNTFWLPQGVQNEVYDKPGKITDEERVRYSCDVSFAGGLKVSAHKHRRQYVDAIEQMGVKFKLWGCRGNPQVYNEEHNKMVSQSKINFCCSSFPGNEKYTSVRNYKIMGAGGFVLELYRTGIYDIFPNNTLDYYRDPSDLVKRIRYWLSNEDERKMTAERAYKWVHENATYTHRIKAALEIMGL